MRTLLPLLAFSLALTPGGGVKGQTPDIHAILIGCSRYPHLGDGGDCTKSRFDLCGPENDVHLFRQLLTGKFAVPSERITTLAGWPRNEEKRPTRANIERIIRDLASKVRPGDQVVVFLSGHGSRQPADKNGKDPEPDGLDELFLPSDVKGWNGGAGTVENAIVDDELCRWLSRITAKRVFVWLIVDACHSATMARGAGEPRKYRRVRPADLGVPEEGFELQGPAAGSRGAGRAEPESEKILGVSSDGDLVAYYAAQAREQAPELPLPSATSPYHGLFTYFVVQALQRADSSMTYRELIERVHTSYHENGHYYPTPTFEGGGKDREVLGLKSWPQRPRLLLGRQDPRRPGAVRLRAGSLQGLTSGSILAVFPPAGQPGSNRRIGYVEVLEDGLRALTSLVEPVPFGDRAAPALGDLREGSRCRVEFYHHGDFKLKVAVQSLVEDGGETTFLTHGAGQGPGPIEDAFTKLSGVEGLLFERAACARDARWFVRFVDGKAYLSPGGPALTRPCPPQYDLGNVRDPGFPAKLETSFKRIARKQNLLRIASSGERCGDAFTGGALDLKIELLAVKDGRSVPVLYGPEGRVVVPGDTVSVRVKNRSRITVDVTLIYVGENMRIEQVFPSRFSDQARLAPGNERTIGPFEITGDDGIYGVDHVVLIGIPENEIPIDFSVLEQSELRTRSRERGAGSGRRVHPLEELLHNALHGKGTRRGFRREEVQQFSIQLLGWRVVPGPN